MFSALIFFFVYSDFCSEGSLLYACLCADRAVALEMIADPLTSSDVINEVNSLGDSALMWAAYQGLGDVCLALLRDPRLTAATINKVDRVSTI